MNSASQKSAPQTIAIIGAGMAGLAAAVGFARAGAGVTLYERNDGPETFGAGIQLSPNAIHALESVGCDRPPANIATPSQAVDLQDALSGSPIARVPLARSDAYFGAPYYIAARRDLIAWLSDQSMRAGVAFCYQSEIEMLDGRPALHGQPIEADLIVIANGAFSRLRSLFDPKTVPTFTGQLAYRAVLPGCDTEATSLCLAPGRHFVRYPLKARNVTNLVGVVERPGWPHSDWMRPASIQEFRDDFSDCPLLHPDIERAQEVMLWALYNHPPLRRLHHDNMVLVGDAAHLMLPYMAQGAAMAFEDASVLVHAVMKYGVAQGQGRYAQARLPRLRRLYHISKRNGWAYHLRQPLARKMAHIGLRLMGQIAPGLLLRGFAPIYGWQPPGLSRR